MAGRGIHRVIVILGKYVDTIRTQGKSTGGTYYLTSDVKVPHAGKSEDARRVLRRQAIERLLEPTEAPSP